MAKQKAIAHSPGALETRSANDIDDPVRCARLLKALAEPARLRIVECLQTGPLSVSDIAELLETDLSNASHHLRMMYGAGLVTTEREGKYIYYSLSEEILSQQRNAHAGHALDFGCCRIDFGDRKQ